MRRSPPPASFVLEMPLGPMSSGAFPDGTVHYTGNGSRTENEKIMHTNHFPRCDASRAWAARRSAARADASKPSMPTIACRAATLYMRIC